MVERKIDLMKDSECTYYAFVSHSHHDSKWATWIWSELEKYRVPRNIRKTIMRPLPERLHPIFIDKADLGPGKIIDELYKELEASRYLIVVCSPESASPNAAGRHYVNDEVGHFVEMGRSDRIIPVIVAGSSATAFCPALKAQNIFAINATKLSRRRVLNDIAAKLLGLRPDELWKREERRHLVSLIRRMVLGIVISMTFIVVGLFALENGRMVEIDYADYVISYGLPQGLFKITVDEAMHADAHYRFIYNGLRYWPNSVHEDTSGNNPFRIFGFKRVLRRVDQIDSAGVPVNLEGWPFENLPQIQIFDEYASDGTLRKMRYAEYIGDGLELKLIKQLVFSDANGIVNAVCEFKGVNHLELAFSQSTPLGDVENRADSKIGEITQHVVTRDAYGRVKTVMFYNANQKIMCDAEGVAGYRFTRDEIGRIVRQTYLDVAGNVCTLKNGVASREFEYDGSVGAVMTYRDINGNPICAANGWARCVSSHDKWRNYNTRIYYGENGERVLTDCNYAECRHVYDERGNLVEHRFYGVDGCPCLHKDGYSGWRSFFDDKGREIRNVWIGIDGRPCLVDGYAEYRCSYNEYGLVAAKRYFDLAGNPCRRQGKDAGWNAEYDEKGREVRNVWVDVCGDPCVVNGYGEYRCSYDDNGNTTSLRYFGIDGQPCLRNGSDGGWNAEYDEHGRLIRKTWVGIDGEPCCRKSGYAEFRCEYDKYGNRSQSGYYDDKGRPCSICNVESDWDESDFR